LLKKVAGDNPVIVFDDGSTDEQVISFLKEKEGQIEVVWGDKHPEVEDRFQLAKRLGKQRAKAVDRFLVSDQEYLLLLDDDIIVGEGVIDEAVRDLGLLRRREGLRVGSLTLHAVCGISGFVQVLGSVFAEVQLSGEANWLFCREALEKTGNHFGEGEKEFADVQVQEMWKAGFKYFERSWVPYAVQHIGVGNGGSIIHQFSNRLPPWVSRPYVGNYKLGKGRLLDVPGFDLGMFLELVGSVSPQQAPALYLEKKGV